MSPSCSRHPEHLQIDKLTTPSISQEQTHLSPLCSTAAASRWELRNCSYLNESFLMSVFLYVVFLCLKHSLHPPLCRSDLCSSFTPQPTRVFQEEASLHPPLPCTSEVAASAWLRELNPQPIQSSSVHSPFSPLGLIMVIILLC